ncbi:MAG: hypothetical protein U0269_19765 [Polyangiales bacterium]
MLYTIGDALLTKGESIDRIARALDATVIDVRLSPPPDGALSETALGSLLGNDYRSWSERMRAARTGTHLLALLSDLVDAMTSIREDQHVLLLGGHMRPELCARSWLASQYEVLRRMAADGHLDDGDGPSGEDTEDEWEASRVQENVLFRPLLDMAHVLASSDDELEVMIGQRTSRYPTTEDELEIIDVIVAFDGLVELLRSKIPADVAVEQRFFDEAADAFRRGDCWQFHNDEIEQHSFFQGWRRTHRNGFVATFKSAKKATLHRTVGCHHMGDTDWIPEQAARSNRDRASLTEAKKLCADERAHIEASLRSTGVELSECAHCFGKH